MGRNRTPDPNQPDLFSILDDAGGDGDRSGDSQGGPDRLLDRSELARRVDSRAPQRVPDGRSGEDQLDDRQHGRGAVGESHRGLEPPAPRPDPESRDQGGPAAGSTGAGSTHSAEQRALRADRPPVAGTGVLGPVSDQGGTPDLGPSRGRPAATRPPRGSLDHRVGADDLPAPTRARPTVTREVGHCRPTVPG